MILRRPTGILAAAFIITWSALVLRAQDWPQWRGAGRDAKTAGFTAPKTWPKELKQVWKTTVGAGDASPVLVGERLYVFSRQETDEVTRCLDAATGKELWTDKCPCATPISGPDARQHSGPRSSPAVGNGRLVTLGVAGTLSCLDAASGTLNWRKDDFPGAWPRFHVASSPLIVNGMVVAQLGKESEGGIFAYDLATGAVKWKWTEEGPGYASPVPCSVAGTPMIVALTAKSVVAVSAVDGTPLWRAPYAPQGMAYNAATPIVEGTTVVYCGQGRDTIAVTLEKQGNEFVAKELWKNPDNAVQFSTPVLRGGFLFGLSARSDFFCINARDGKTVWTAPLSPAAAGADAQPQPQGQGGMRGGRGMGRTAGYGSIVDAGSVLLALSPASQLVVFEPNDKAYTELARIKVTDSPTYTYPVVSGKRLFVKDQDAITLWNLE
ncbi:MAG TPA: PQQ-like beta-propeller repeat protein [Verrucomicrobiota bacterium]|nr:PQQ-like beta-propeller repeat protein [Verrucomicrobiota bacterium]HNU50049.1 PQQ-like beta-propeller repeat protein [Verrucomicrobiota bacterium]